MNLPRLKGLGVIAVGLRCAAGLIRQWPLILLALCIVVPPTNPHLRWEYSYESYGSVRVYSDCHYLGLRGFVRYARTGHCPLIIWIDDKEQL